MISCQLYDYIEIACMYHYQVEVTFHDQTTMQGRAMTTEISKNKKEWLVLEQPDETIKVEMDKMISMRALTDNPHFEQVKFD